MVRVPSFVEPTSSVAGEAEEGPAVVSDPCRYDPPLRLLPGCLHAGVGPPDLEALLLEAGFAICSE